MPPLEDMFAALEEIRSVNLFVYQNRCVAVRNRNASCTRCAQACTSQAISLVDNKLVVEATSCIGCGTCATMCPTCALEARHPNDIELRDAVMTAAANNDGTAVVACREIVEAAGNLVDDEKVVAVECLGRVEESLIMACAAAGQRCVTLVKGACEKCDHSVGLDTVHAVCDTANELLRVWHSDMPVKIVDRFPSSVRSAAEPTYGEVRRNFFLQVREGGTQAVTAVAGRVVDDMTNRRGMRADEEQPRYLKVMDDGTLPHFLPDRRERLLDSLAALGEPDDEFIETRLWGHVVIDVDACRGCRMCAVFCPTGAIVKFDEDGQRGIYHYPGDCVKCRCCEDVCPDKAITVYDEILAVDIVDGKPHRYEMPDPDIDYTSPKKGIYAMRKVTGFSEIYER